MQADVLNYRGRIKVESLNHVYDAVTYRIAEWVRLEVSTVAPVVQPFPAPSWSS